MLLKDKIDKKAAWERRRMDAEKRKGCSWHVHHDHRCEKCVVYLEKEIARVAAIAKITARLIAEGHIVFSPVAYTAEIQKDGDPPAGWYQRERDFA